MSPVQKLYQLQTLDLELAELERRRGETEAQLGETEALLQARAHREAARQRCRQEEARLRDLELDVEETGQKLKEVQAKLYGGTVRAAKELTNLQKESEHLAQAKSRAEDALLESMDALERLQAELAEAERAFDAAEAEWKADQEALRARLQETLAAIAKATASREELIRTIPPAALAEYDRLRRIRRGVAVARIAQNTCLGCRIGLPMSVVQQARVSPDFVYCPSCGRLLCS